MFIIDSKAQESIEKVQTRFDAMAQDAAMELQRCYDYQCAPDPTRLDSVNRAMFLGQTDTERGLQRSDAWVKHPNEMAIRALVDMFVQDSPRAKARRWKTDAGEARLFELQLRHVVSQVTRTFYIRNQARTLAPVDTSIPAGAETVLKQRVIDEDFAPAAGDFGQISPRGDDIIMVDVSGTNETHQLASFARGTSYSLDELEAAAFAGVALRTEKLSALSRAVDSIFDMVALQGYASANFTGLYNDANPAVTVPTTGTWATATADQILADIHDLYQAIKLATGYNEAPTRLVIPSSLTEFLSLRRANTDLNVRMMVAQDFPGLEIVECDRANLYDVAGTGPRIMMLTPNMEYVNIAVPREWTLEPPEKHHFKYEIVGRQKLGGCIMSVPLTVGYMDGC